MPLERPSNRASIIEVFDHVLDKGIVVDAWVHLSVVGIDLLTHKARVIVASIESYLTDAASFSDRARRPRRPRRTLVRP